MDRFDVWPELRPKTNNTVTWTFDLSCTDGAFSFRCALDGSRYLHALQTLDSWLRTRIKYHDNSEETDAALVDCRRVLFGVTEESGVTIWD